MKAFISALLRTHELRTSGVTALFLALLVTAPVYGQSSHAQKARLDATLSARQDYATHPTDRSALISGTELISDGSFEAGPSPDIYGFSTLSSAWTWQSSGGFMASLDPRYTDPSTNPAHTGNWCVFFDLGPSADHLAQTVSIPSGATATLSFWLKIGTVGGSSSFDSLTVSVRDATGSNLLGNIASYYAGDSVGFSYVQHSFDVSAYAGRTLRLQFDTNQVSMNTLFLLDDVSLLTNLTTSATCTEDVSTMCLVNGRYKVTSHWKNQYAGGVVANLSKAKLTDKEGAFWIADASTHEYLIRFNTATNNGRVWIAIPTFTDVEFWVAVTDTVNGQYKEYHSNPGNQTLIYDPSFFVYP
jgi:hypothetical protein